MFVLSNAAMTKRGSTSRRRIRPVAPPGEMPTSAISMTSGMALLLVLGITGFGIRTCNVEGFVVPTAISSRYASCDDSVSRSPNSCSSTSLWSVSDVEDHNSLEMAFEREGSSGAASSVAPTRTKKHQSRTKPSAKTKTKNKRSQRRSSKQGKKASSDPLSESEIGHHVATQYITGPGGLLRDKSNRRERMAKADIIQNDPTHQEQMEYLRMLDRHPALVLNADYQPMSLLPLSLWCWQDAVKAIFAGKVTVVDTYPDVFIRAVNIDMPLPSVIALNDYVPKKDQTPAFTRRNVFLRDGYQCQYCNEYFKTNDLTLDHFVPRSMGGRLEWKNAVSSCRKCNGRKGSVHPKRLPSIGMRVLQEPRVPTQWELATRAGKMMPKRVHPTWQPYLGVIAADPITEETETTQGFSRNRSKPRGKRVLRDHVDDMFGELLP